MKKIFLAILTLALVVSCNRSGKAPVMAEDPASQTMAGSPGRVIPGKEDVKIEKVEGVVSIGNLLADKAAYDGKIITVSGKITKVNKAILGKNWLHIQDGTEFEGLYDLTITTALEPLVGDVVTLKGKITLNKDFGYGYFYDILMEDAVFAE